MRFSRPFAVTASVALVCVLSVQDASGQGLFRRLRERIGNAAGTGNAPAANPTPRLPARPIPSASSEASARQSVEQANRPLAENTSNLPSARYRLPGQPDVAPSNRYSPVRPAGGTNTSSGFGRSILAPLDGDLDESLEGDVDKDLNGAASSARLSNAASLGIKGIAANPGYPGVRVTEILPHSETISAGLRVGDYIFAIDERPTPTVPQLADEVSARRPGDKVRLRIGRQGRVFEIDVPLVTSPAVVASPTAQVSFNEARRFDPSERFSPPPVPSLPSPAATVNQSDRQLGAQVINLSGRRGVRIESIDEGGPADSAGFRIGDEIVAVDGNLVSDARTLRRLLASLPQESVEVRFIRGDRLVNETVDFAASLASPSRASSPESDTSQSVDSPPVASTPLDGIGAVLGVWLASGAEAKSSKEAAKANEGDFDSVLELPPPESATKVAPANEPKADPKKIRDEIESLKEKLKRLEAELEK